MEDDNTTDIRFTWYLQNPFLPAETKEAIFCSRIPMINQWKATLQRGRGRRSVNYWPVSFTLQYFPLDPEEEVELKVTVSVEFHAVGNDLPSPVDVVFNRDNSYTYTYNSSIRPEHGLLKVITEIEIPDKYKKTELDPISFSESIEALGNDLKRLRTDRLYFDLWLQSKDPGTRFPAHSCILDVRWFHFFRGLAVQPNPNDPPIVETDLSPDVLDDILTHLYTGSVEHLFLKNPNPSFQDFFSEMLQAMDRYLMHHLYMLIKNDSHHNRKTTTHISSSAMTFRLRYPIKTLDEDYKLGPHAWTHSPIPGVCVKTSLEFTFLPADLPSLSYTLWFTNAMKLYGRVCVEYRRRVVELGHEMRRNLFERDHDIPCGGTEVHVSDEIIMEVLDSPLFEFSEGLDSRDGSFEVEHSLRFILHLSKGDKHDSIVGDHYDFDQELSHDIFRKHMSNMRRRRIGANLRASGANLQGTASGSKRRFYRLHKAIFAARIPNWRNVIEEAPRDDGRVPNRVTCILNNAAFPHVVDFLYTGTCSPPSDTLHLQISHFASQGGLTSLASMPRVGMPAYERQVSKKRRLM